jgi:hypothetical protein
MPPKYLSLERRASRKNATINPLRGCIQGTIGILEHALFLLIFAKSLHDGSFPEIRSASPSPPARVASG